MLGERIRQRRKELRFSLRKLGARTGLTASFSARSSTISHLHPSLLCRGSPRHSKCP